MTEARKRFHFYRISRRYLYESLGFQSERIPPALSQIVDGVLLHRSDYTSIGRYRVRIAQADGSYAKHRIFVTCECGREIPFGRFHQHKVACK